MIAQIFIAIFGVSAIFLVGAKEQRHRKWGYVVGLLGQPFWMYVTWEAQQWGIFFLTFCYTFSWINGIRNNWHPDVWKFDRFFKID